jgi:LemA protein
VEILVAVLVVVVVLAIVYIALYNGLIGRRNQVENAFGSVDTMLKKRYDLIPNLVSAVKQYMTYETELLERIVRLRTQAMGTSNPDQKFQLEGQLSQALRGLMVSVENYPDLKASENMLQLQSSLTETEEQISAARRFYNASVTDFNNAVEMFPSSIIASSMGLTRKAVFP